MKNIVKTSIMLHIIAITFILTISYLLCKFTEQKLTLEWIIFVVIVLGIQNFEHVKNIYLAILFKHNEIKNLVL